MVDKQIVSVKVDYNGRALIFGDVVCRVSPKYALAMHVDTDEVQRRRPARHGRRRDHPVKNRGAVRGLRLPRPFLHPSAPRAAAIPARR